MDAKDEDGKLPNILGSGNPRDAGKVGNSDSQELLQVGVYMSHREGPAEGFSPAFLDGEVDLLKELPVLPARWKGQAS